MWKLGCVAAVLVVGLLLGLLYHKVMWEPPAYRQVYDSISPGMNLSEVGRRFRQLSPKALYGWTGPIRREGSIEIRVLGTWQYSISFDNEGRVTGKRRYMD